MARQVFFDPFGRAAEGQNLGMQQQMNLEHGMREARAQDYDYNVMAPYRLAATQRGDILGAAALPYQLQMPAIGLDEAKTALAAHQLPLSEGFARATGIMTPWANTYAHAFGLTPTGADQQGNYGFTMRGPNGQPVNVGSYNPQGTMDFLNLPQQMELSKLQAMNEYYRSMAQYGRMGPYGSYYDLQRGNYYGAGGPTQGRNPQAQGGSPVDRFFPTPAGGGQGGGQGGMTGSAPSNPYNLPGGSGGVNYGGAPSVQQLQQSDYP